MKKRVLAVLAAVLLAVAFMPVAASAALYATNVTNAVWYENGGGTIGTQFQVGGTPVTVVKLGIFDNGSDGLNASHAVGIWNSAGNLLASVSVASGTTAPLDQGFRWASLTTPVTLIAGQSYTLGAFYDASAGVNDFFGDGATINPLFTLQKDLYIDDNSGLKLPTTGFQTTVTGWYGPNLATPIPAAVWLLGSGLVGLVAIRRRMKK